MARREAEGGATLTTYSTVKWDMWRELDAKEKAEWVQKAAELRARIKDESADLEPPLLHSLYVYTQLRVARMASHLQNAVLSATPYRVTARCSLGKCSR